MKKSYNPFEMKGTILGVIAAYIFAMMNTTGGIFTIMVKQFSLTYFLFYPIFTIASLFNNCEIPILNSTMGGIINNYFICNDQLFTTIVVIGMILYGGSIGWLLQSIYRKFSK
jgi:hypothetical protein